jgi:flagellar P-ring protein precursor FlgI
MTKIDGFEKALAIMFFTIFYMFISTNLFADKIKNISSIIGVRDNQLIGYGLVVGLDGTGDSTSSKFTNQTLSNLLKNVNVKLDPKDIKSKNVAAVMVTATLPPFAREGDKICLLYTSPSPRD